MSKIGAFVLECQTLAEDTYNMPIEKAEVEIRKYFKAEPQWKQDYAVETTLGYVKEIHEDFNSIPF